MFIGEDDKYEDQPLYEWIVHKARERGLAGATVQRELEGFARIVVSTRQRLFGYQVIFRSW